MFSIRLNALGELINGPTLLHQSDPSMRIQTPHLSVDSRQSVGLVWVEENLMTSTVGHNVLMMMLSDSEPRISRR